MPDQALLLMTSTCRNCTAVGAGGACTQRMSTVTKAADTSNTVQVRCPSQRTLCASLVGIKQLGMVKCFLIRLASFLVCSWCHLHSALMSLRLAEAQFTIG
jgi:hypothetical protein